MKATGARRRLVARPHTGRFAALEGYRAAAALGVLLYHCSFATGVVRPDAFGGILFENLGGFCVAVFFVMSGFLLYRPMCSSIRDEQPLPNRGQFIVRRLLRIYPGYWLALIGWALVEPTVATSRGNSWAIFLLLDSYVPPLQPYTGLSVAWTLSIEIAFYFSLVVIASIVAVASRRLATPRARFQLQLVVLTALAIGALVFLTSMHSSGEIVPAYRWIFSYFDWFALGMLLAVLSAWTERGAALPAAVQGLLDHGEWCLVLAFGCYLGIAASIDGQFGLSRFDTTAGAVYRHIAQGIAATLLIAPAVLGRPDQFVVRTMTNRTLATLGVISYGIYLWHNVVLSWLQQRSVIDGRLTTFAWVTTVTLAVTIVLALISHRFVEMPASNLGRRGPQHHNRTAIAPAPAG